MRYYEGCLMNVFKKARISPLLPLFCVNWGGERRLIIISPQLFLGFWFVYSLLITTYYKTSLTARLAVPSVPPTIDTLDQLLRSNLKFGMIDAKVTCHSKRRQERGIRHYHSRLEGKRFDETFDLIDF